MKKMVLVLCLLWPGFLWAGVETDQVKRLMEAQGVLQLVEMQLNSVKTRVEGQAAEMMGQLTDSMDLNADFQGRFEKLLQKFSTDTANSWRSDAILLVWGKLYGEKFTKDEMEQLIAFYSSPLGQREQEASKEAMKMFSEHFTKVVAQDIQGAMKGYVDGLKALVKECDCEKKADEPAAPAPAPDSAPAPDAKTP